MKIGIDFDNTLVNTYEVSKHFLDVYKPNNNLNSYHDLPQNEELDFFNKYVLKITDYISLFEGVKEGFEFFKDNNIETVLITARGNIHTGAADDLVGPTKKFLKKHNIHFDKMIFGDKNKGEICKKNHIDLLIDDNDAVLADAVQKGIKVLKYGEKSNKYPYVLNWQEVIDYIRKEILCE